MHHEVGVRHRGQKGREKRDRADCGGRTQLPAQDRRLDFGSGEEGQHDASEAGDEVDPCGRPQSDEIPGQHTQQNLDQRGGESDTPRDEGGRGREREPHGCKRPEIVGRNRERHVRAGPLKTANRSSSEGIKSTAPAAVAIRNALSIAGDAAAASSVQCAGTSAGACAPNQPASTATTSAPTATRASVSRCWATSTITTIPSTRAAAIAMRAAGAARASKSPGSLWRASSTGTIPAIHTATVARTARRRKSSRNAGSADTPDSRTRKTAATCAHSATLNAPTASAKG